jgi:hypothetical protein
MQLFSRPLACTGGPCLDGRFDSCANAAHVNPWQPHNLVVAPTGGLASAAAAGEEAFELLAGGAQRGDVVALHTDDDPDTPGDPHVGYHLLKVTAVEVLEEAANCPLYGAQFTAGEAVVRGDYLHLLGRGQHAAGRRRAAAAGNKYGMNAKPESGNAAEQRAAPGARAAQQAMVSAAAVRYVRVEVLAMALPKNGKWREERLVPDAHHQEIMSAIDMHA